MYVHHENISLSENMAFNFIDTQDSRGTAQRSDSIMLIPTWDAYLFACGETYAIITTDNYDRDSVSDKLIDIGFTKHEAGIKCDDLNSQGYDNVFFTRRDNRYALKQGMIDLV